MWKMKIKHLNLTLKYQTEESSFTYVDNLKFMTRNYVFGSEKRYSKCSHIQTYVYFYKKTKIKAKKRQQNQT